MAKITEFRYLLRLIDKTVSKNAKKLKWVPQKIIRKYNICRLQ